MAFLPTAVAMGGNTDHAVAHSWWWCAKESRRQSDASCGSCAAAASGTCGAISRRRQSAPALTSHGWRSRVTSHPVQPPASLPRRRRPSLGANEPHEYWIWFSWVDTSLSRAFFAATPNAVSFESASNRADSAGCASAALSTTDSSRTISLRTSSPYARAAAASAAAALSRTEGMLSASCSQNVRRRAGSCTAHSGAKWSRSWAHAVHAPSRTGHDWSSRQSVRAATSDEACGLSAAVGSLAASSPAQRHAASRTAWFSASAMPT